MRYLPILLLSGCSIIQPKPELVEVPVTIPCITSIPEKPEFPFDAIKAEDYLTEKVKALLIERKVRDGYEAELLAVIQGCV